MSFTLAGKLKPVAEMILGEPIDLKAFYDKDGWLFVVRFGDGLDLESKIKPVKNEEKLAMRFAAEIKRLKKKREKHLEKKQ